jgi:hypothetical protein
MTISRNQPSEQLGAALLASVMALGACSVDSRDLSAAAPDSLLPSSERDGASDGKDAAVRAGTGARGDAGVGTGAAPNSTGSGLAPAALQAPDALDFGGVPRPSSAARTLTLKNAGDEATGPITALVSGPAAADFTVQQNACASGIAPQASCSLPLTFAPSAAGGRLATLALTGMAAGTRSVALSGQGLDPGSLTVQPESGSAYFGAGIVGGASQPQTQTFVVDNPSTTASGILTLSVVGAAFQISDPAGSDCINNSTNLQPLGSCTVRVAFAPTEVGPASATLSVSSTAAGSTSVPLSGVGVHDAHLVTDQVAVVFDSSTQPRQTANSILSVRNSGDLTTGTISAAISAGSSDFSVSAGTCGALTTSGGCSLAVSFTPSVSVPVSATIHVTSDPGGGFDIPVRAAGQAPAAIHLVAKDGSDFGVVPVNSSRTLSFVVFNDGDFSAGLFYGLTTASSDYTAFMPATDDLPYECHASSTELGPGAGCTERFVFAPTTPGSYSIILNASAQSGGSANLTVTGTAQ